VVASVVSAEAVVVASAEVAAEVSRIALAAVASAGSVVAVADSGGEALSNGYDSPRH